MLPPMLKRWLHSRVVWIACLIPPPAASVAYLLHPTTLAWWMGLVAALPITVLASLWMAVADDEGDGGDAAGGYPDGPWGPPA